MNGPGDSPFETPGLLTGYPLNEEERRELDEALRRIEDEAASRPHGSESTSGPRAAETADT